MNEANFICCNCYSLIRNYLLFENYDKIQISMLNVLIENFKMLRS